MKPTPITRRLLVFTTILLFTMSQAVNAQTEKQSTKSDPPRDRAISVSNPDALSPAAEQLRNYRGTSNDPVLNDLNYRLLELEVQLSEGKRNNSLSSEQVSSLQRDIALTKEKISSRSGERKAVNRIASETPRILSRSQFVALPIEQQQEAASSLKTEITDLVNAAPGQLTLRNPDLFYIVADQFNDLPVDRKIIILNRPDKYVVVNKASDIPKIKIPRSEFESLPKVKQQAMMNSGEFMITD